ncbi:MAG: hypothetical protein KF845_04990 [Cyclobacteriaceae bacterium]|nr:hypothetical protein [Cyclobacteriaceae bacterium]
MILLFACDQHKDAEIKISDLDGNWYLDYGWGPIDTTINYTEFYIKDSVLSATDETAGQSRPQRVVVKSDSIYFSDYYDFENLVAFYKILGLKNDTLWLRFNPFLMARWDTVFWVRLPENEKGFYDHNWTDEKEDSLFNQSYKDYHRRMLNHHFSKKTTLEQNRN